MRVTLTWSEAMQAALVGVMRQIQNLKAARRDSYGADVMTLDGWGIHIEGAGGEMAVAKVRDRFWGGVGVFRGADVAGLQVRTGARPTHRLIIHPEDLDAAVFVLVTGRLPTYTVKGWILGADAKRPEWWEDPTGSRPAFFVPQAALNPMVLLTTMPTG